MSDWPCHDNVGGAIQYLIFNSTRVHWSKPDMWSNISWVFMNWCHRLMFLASNPSSITAKHLLFKIQTSGATLPPISNQCGRLRYQIMPHMAVVCYSLAHSTLLSNRGDFKTHFTSALGNVTKPCNLMLRCHTEMTIYVFNRWSKYTLVKKKSFGSIFCEYKLLSSHLKRSKLPCVTWGRGNPFNSQ